MSDYAALFGGGKKPPVTIPLWFLESGTWTAPVKGRAIVHMIGAGGCGYLGATNYSIPASSPNTCGGAGAWGMNCFDLQAGDELNVLIGAGSIAPYGHNGGTYMDGGPSILKINNEQKMHIPGGRHGNRPFGEKETADPTGVLHGHRGYTALMSQTEHASGRFVGGDVAFQCKRVYPGDQRTYAHGALIGFDPVQWGIVSLRPKNLDYFASRDNGRFSILTYANSIRDDRFGRGAKQYIESGSQKYWMPGIGGGGGFSNELAYTTGGAGYAFVQFLAEV
ncbi:MAG: hypothetical protein Q4A98_00780 [Comamonadaceae bacterium]|nr:hypothetical protein [Comamonadaceae bacterium]